MASNNCLLCYKECTISSVKRPDDKGKTDTDKSSLVDNQVVIIFAIRKLLGIPKDFCHQILPPGKDSSKWITSCENCRKLMEDAYTTFKEITTLHCRFNCLKTKVNETLQMSIGTNAVGDRKTDMIRKFISTDVNKRNCKNNSLLDTLVTEEDSDLLVCKDDAEVVVKAENDDDMEENGEDPFPHFEDYEEEFDGEHCEKKFTTAEFSIVSNASHKRGASCDSDLSTKQAPNVENTDRGKTRTGLRKSTIIARRFPESNDNQKNESSDHSDSDDSMSESDTDTNDGSGTSDSEISENELLENRKEKKAEIFHCEPCGNTYNTKVSLQSHIYLKHKEKNRCPKCPKEFLLQSKLNLHCAKFHPEIRNLAPDKVPCEKCKQSFDKQSLTNHACQLNCELCGKKVYSNKYTMHKRGFHYKELNLEPFKCEQCHKVFKRQSCLNGHMTSIHLKNYSIFCSICNAGFLKKSALQTHVNAVHEKVKNFSCSTCDRKFSHKIHLDRHIVYKHTKDFKFICAVCGHGSVSNASLKIHMSVHSEAKLFSCEICGEAFNVKSRLVDHHRGKHYKELNLEPHKCRDCGRIFICSSSLRVHCIKVHTKEFKSVCNLCDKSFISDSTLQGHIRAQHTGERPFKCTFCDKKFFTNRKLKLHSQIHSEFKFKCQMCEKGYVTNWELVRHMKTHNS